MTNKIKYMCFKWRGMVEENFGTPLKNEISSIGTFPCYICEKYSIGWLVLNNGIDNDEI